MPPRSRARTGPAEPTPTVAEQSNLRVPAESPQPSRRSARILRKTKEKESQLTATAQKRSPTKKPRQERAVPSDPKPRRGNKTQQKKALADIPKRTTTQISKTKYTQKTRKATPVAVSGQEAVSRPLSSPQNQFTANATWQNPHPEASFSESGERSNVVPEIVEFYQSRGYEVPEEASMASAIDGGTVASSKASTKNSKYPKLPKDYVVDSGNRRFTATLLDHNIVNLPSEDPEIEYYRQLVSGGRSDTNPILTPLESAIQRRDDALWQTDMSKCARSNEANFQRTIMMTILNRQELDEQLDFTCEAEWISERFPCLDCFNFKCKLTKPKPDLAVAFRSESLLPTNGNMADFARLKTWQGSIFPEGMQEFQNERAFYFFSIEAKGKRGMLDNQKAQFQNLNTASQALYNIYRCMKRVNDLETFFKEVRVFSIVATVEGLLLRVHRPHKLVDGQANHPEYPIGFRFDNLGHLKGDYSRAQASTMVYNILYKYGVEKLHPILKKTIEKLLELHPRQRPQHSLRDLEQAAAAQVTQDETDPELASQRSSSRKRHAPDQGGSFTGISRRRLGNFDVGDSQEFEASVEGRQR